MSPAYASASGGRLDGSQPGYEGPLRKGGFDPLFLAALVFTGLVHLAVVAWVVTGQQGKTDEKGPELNVMVTKLVRKGKPRDPRLLPQRYEPPKATAPVKGPILTEDTKAAAAKKEKPRDREADPDKVLRERMQKLRSQSNQPPLDTQPEGSEKGSEQGTAANAQEGDPCATAIHNAVAGKFKLPETISDRDASRLSARVRIRIGRDGAMSDAKLVSASRNSVFDDQVLAAIEQAGRDGEAKTAIAKECGGKAMSPTLRFNGKDLK